MLSATLEQAILKHVLGIEAWQMPTTLYLALFTTNPVMPAGTGGVEVTGGGYVRMAITYNVSGSGPASANSAALIEFPTATADWGTITGAGVYDDPVAGNLIDASPLQVSKTIGLGDVFAMPAGNYTINLT